MSLKLPIPLPYDVIDEYLNEKFIFEPPYKSEFGQDEIIVFKCCFRNPTTFYDGGYSHYMFNFRTDIGEIGHTALDEDGYFDTTNTHLSGSSMIFSNPPTDKELDTWIHSGTGSRI